MSQAARNIKERNRSKNTDSVEQSSSQLAGVFFLLVVVGAFLWCGWAIVNWMDDSDHLPLSTLVISGDRKFTSDDDIRMAVLALGEPKTFMAQDVDEIQQQIQHALPWVQQVSVRKQWPDELKIHLVEFVPYALWNDSLLMDVEGHVFSLPSERVAGNSYPQLYGSAGSEKVVLNGYREMQQRLDDQNIKIQAVAVSARLAWQILLADGTKLELGRSDRMLRLERFVTLYPLLSQQTSGDQRIINIDLRYETGAAVSYGPNFIQ